MKSREKRDCWIYAICMMILAEAFSWFQPIYTNVDNFITSMVIGAVYDKDTYSMVLNPGALLDYVFRRKGTSDG